jgi:hypothetical protein
MGTENIILSVFPQDNGRVMDAGAGTEIFYGDFR